MKSELRSSIQLFIWILSLAKSPVKELLVVGACYLIISVFDLLGLGVLFVFLKQYLFGGDEFLIFGRALSPVSILWVVPLIWVLEVLLRANGQLFYCHLQS